LDWLKPREIKPSLREFEALLAQEEKVGAYISIMKSLLKFSGGVHCLLRAKSVFFFTIRPVILRNDFAATRD
jgi:hypothetical protein